MKRADFSPTVLQARAKEDIRAVMRATENQVAKTWLDGAIGAIDEAQAEMAKGRK